MKFATAAFVASVAALAVAAPTKTIEKRAQNCEQYGSVTTGSYIVYNDLWGESGATSGSQCFEVDGLSGTTLSWKTTWTWVGGSSIKSYANAVTSFTSTKLTNIKSMKSTWKWSYSGSPTNADVAYDIFTSSSAGGSNEYEIMIWLAAIGDAGPISYNYGSDGKPTAVATVTIDGYSWNVYYGSNGSNYVYSFLPASGSEITSFSGDVLAFITYLTAHQTLPSSQYLTSVGAGTEATAGTNAVFTVSAYSMVISE